MRKLILMSGVSGSGKSTYAKNLKLLAESDGASCRIHSTDAFHMRYNTDIDKWEYKFDRANLGRYHVANQAGVAQSMSDDDDLIIVDNTNLSFKEIKPYVLLAATFGYDVEIIEPDSSWAKIPEECANKNVHGVPLAVIKNMFSRKTPVDVLKAKTEALLNVVRGFA